MNSISLPWIKRALRFCISGLLVTLVHICIATFLIRCVNTSPGFSNGVAFCVANAFSYLIHTLWSFSSTMGSKVLFKFLVVSGMGLALSSSIGEAIDWMGFSYSYGILAVVLVMPPFNFLVHHFWTYAPKHTPETRIVSREYLKD